MKKHRFLMGVVFGLSMVACKKQVDYQAIVEYGTSQEQFDALSTVEQSSDPVAAVATFLSSSHRYVREEAMTVCARLGAQAKPLLQELLFADSRPGKIAVVLSNMEAEEELSAIFARVDVERQIIIFDALVQTDHFSADVLNVALTQVASCPDEKRFDYALGIASQLRNGRRSGGVPSELRAKASDVADSLIEEQARAAASIDSALSELGDSSAFDRLCGLREHFEAEVRAWAAVRLGDIDRKEALDCCYRMLDDADDRVKVRALDCVARFGSSASYAEAKVRALSSENESKEVREAAEITLIKIEPE